MKEIDFESLKSIVKSNRDKRVMLTFHSIGDTDSISSAFGLIKFFKNGKMAAPDFITGNSKRILDRLGFNQDEIATEFDENADMVVLLDVNNFEDCGRFKTKLENFKNTILIIDHHTPNNIKKENVYTFNDESYNSAASIVYELIKSEGIIIEKNLANLLATGIISDSAEFRNAFPKTFIQMGELLEKSGTDYQSILLEMHHIASLKTREEFIKDLFNSNIMISNEMLMLCGKTAIHSNKTADDGIKIGADLSLFYTIREKEISFSARLRPPLDKTKGINLGKIMKALGPIIEGKGGGHPCAAGAYGPGTQKANTFIESFFEEIRKRT